MSKISKAFLLKNRKQYKRSNAIELVNYLVLIMVVIFMGVAIYSLTYLKLYAEEIPTEEKIQSQLQNKGENSKIYDRNGVHLYTFKDPDRDREYVKFEDIPPEVIAAALGAEDKDFFIHNGIDFLATAKGIYITLASNGEDKVGGSTITQQLIKQTLLTGDRTFDRKMKEAILAMVVERDYTKDEILEYYLNAANYGGRVQGIRTASLTYFDKPLEQLSLNEAVFLMGLVQSPGEYSPLFANDKKKATELSNKRRIFILEQIESNPRILAYLNTHDLNYLHKLPEEEAHIDITGGANEPRYTVTKIKNMHERNFKFNQPFDELRAPHWVFYIRDLLQSAPYNLSIQDLYSGGYKIYTSLDIKVQELSEKKLKESVDIYGPRYRFSNGALVAADPGTGEILAMVGSKGYYLHSDPSDTKFDPQVNVAVARQSLGSSLKPWVTYLAFETGKYNRYSIVQDTPQTFYGWYRPKNSDGGFMGSITLHKALLESRNLPFLKISYAIGEWQLSDLMHKVGYRKDTKYGLSATIGGVDETLLDHTIAYTGFANGGNVMQPKPILRIVNQDGSIKFKAKDQLRYSLNRNSVANVNSILGDKSYVRGTYYLKFPGGYKWAGKTGTSDGNKDTYYMGYGPKLLVGVWAGNNDNTSMTRNAFGSYTTLQMWNHIVAGIVSQYPQYAENGSY